MNLRDLWIIYPKKRLFYWSSCRILVPQCKYSKDVSPNKKIELPVAEEMQMGITLGAMEEQYSYKYFSKVEFSTLFNESTL